MKATNYHAMVDRKGGRQSGMIALIHPAPEMLVETRTGHEYTLSKSGQILRANKDHRTKKERNRDKRLKRMVNEAI